MKPLPTLHYNRQITAQITVTDSDGIAGEGLPPAPEYMRGRIIANHRGSSLRITFTAQNCDPFQRTTAIRALSQNVPAARCDLQLFVLH